VTFERPNSHRACTFIAVPAAIAIVVTIGCQSSPMRREPGLNVLLITIDTLRADALGAYGNATVSTPWLDRLSGGGVRFSRAMAQSVVTLPSHANILSGRYPFRHGVRENSGFRFPADVETMATLLKARGYRTGAIDPALTKAHNGLGVVVAQRGVFEEAATHWKQAVTLDPHDHQALFNLGDVLIRLGRPAEARTYWASYLREAPGSDEKDRARVRMWLNR